MTPDAALHNRFFHPMGDDKHGGGVGDGDFYTRMKNLERQIEFIDLQVRFLCSWLIGARRVLVDCTPSVE